MNGSDGLFFFIRVSDLESKRVNKLISLGDSSLGFPDLFGEVLNNVLVEGAFSFVFWFLFFLFFEFFKFFFVFLLLYLENFLFDFKLNFKFFELFNLFGGSLFFGDVFNFFDSLFNLGDFLNDLFDNLLFLRSRGFTVILNVGVVRVDISKLIFICAQLLLGFLDLSF